MPTHYTHNRVAMLVVLLLLAATWWLRAPLHALPLERDEGAYATIAARLLAGDRLYQDLFDHKPPLVHLVYTLAAAAPGDPVVAVRILATLYLMATAMLLLALAWCLYGRRAALASLALLLAYASSWRFQGLTFNSEAVMLLPATLGCLLAVVALLRQRPWLLLGAGVAVGLAVLAKPIGLALVVPLLLAPILARWRWQSSLLALSLGAGGVAMPLALFALLIWAQGSIGAANEALLIYNRLYAAESVAQGWDLTQLWRIWQPMLTLAIPALLGWLWLSLALVAQRNASPPGLRAAHSLATLWGWALLATAFLSLRPYPHYYLAALPLLSLWAGSGLAWLAQSVAQKLERSWFALLATSFAVLVMIAPVPNELASLRHMPPDEQISHLYAWDGAQYFAPARAVAAYVAANVPPDQPIFVWAAEPQIYYMAQRRPASRFVYDYPVDRLPGARDELLADLRRAPPPLIITYAQVRPIGFHPFFEEEGYVLTTTLGGFDLFERVLR
ncbi:MAG: hypothetical protein EI684_07570, partial [Candidatus Viridilinea halotolerans]